MALRNRGFLGLSQIRAGRSSSGSDLGGSMSPRIRRTAALAGGAAVLAFGAYTVGSQAGDGGGQRPGGPRSGVGFVPYGGGPGGPPPGGPPPGAPGPPGTRGPGL